MSTITIRKLIRKDRVTLAHLIKKLAEKVGSAKLLNLMSADASASKSEEKSDDTFISIGVQILNMIIETLEQDAAAWFADLCGKTTEEFDQLPFDVEVQIVKQLIESEEANDFFTGASHLSSKIKELAGRLSRRKDQSDTITG